MVRVAVVQDASIAFDTARTLERVEQHCRAAAGQGAELILFPETFLPGYPAALDWPGPAAAFRSDAGSRDYLTYWRQAVEQGDATDAALGAIAGELGVQLHVGVVERVGKSLCNAVMSYCRDGSRLGVRRKVMPTYGERTVWAAADGSSLQVHSTDCGQVGVAICWENYMPLLRTALYAQGVEIYLAPTADDSDGWLASMRHIALEGRCFVLSACQFAQRSDYPAGYSGLDAFARDDVLFAGGSCIIGPDGTVLAGPMRGGRGLLFADLDLGQTVTGKHALDVAGHYARPDIFALHIDRRTRPLSGVRVVSDFNTDEG